MNLDSEGSFCRQKYKWSPVFRRKTAQTANVQVEDRGSRRGTTTGKRFKCGWLYSFPSTWDSGSDLMFFLFCNDVLRGLLLVHQYHANLVNFLLTVFFLPCSFYYFLPPSFIALTHLGSFHLDHSQRWTLQNLLNRCVFVTAIDYGANIQLLTRNRRSFNVQKKKVTGELRLIMMCWQQEKQQISLHPPRQQT